MKAYEYMEGCTSLNGLRRIERDEPTPSCYEALVRVRATSLNARDVAILRGKFFQGVVTRNLIPLSDGAGEVVAIGSQVTRVKTGDRVAATFFQVWTDGPRLERGLALGNPKDGMLSEYVVLHEDGLISIPEALSFQEAATLPCAALTAWNALVCTGRAVAEGDVVLCLGTGGVSMFALELAKRAGAHVIVTSSSDAKLSRVRDLGAERTINYNSCPEWGKEVLDLTNGHGADHIIEVGSGTLRRSCQAVAYGGKIALIGVLAGLEARVDPLQLMMRNGSIHGVTVGPRRMFEELIRALSGSTIEQLIDSVFPFEEAHEAFRYYAKHHFVGKIVITV